MKELLIFVGAIVLLGLFLKVMAFTIGFGAAVGSLVYLAH